MDLMFFLFIFLLYSSTLDHSTTAPPPHLLNLFKEQVASLGDWTSRTNQLSLEGCGGRVVIATTS